MFGHTIPPHTHHGQANECAEVNVQAQQIPAGLVSAPRWVGMLVVTRDTIGSILQACILSPNYVAQVGEVGRY
jgi:hypothetical protein